jgi:CRISPR-associated endonuclease/helicase Cas3
MIEENTFNVVAPYKSGPELVETLRRDGPTREGFRALQRFTPGMREQQFNALYAGGWLEPVFETSHRIWFQ